MHLTDNTNEPIRLYPILTAWDSDAADHPNDVDNMLNVAYEDEVENEADY